MNRRSWSSVDKSKLPKSCFLYIEGDGSKKEQWHLPVYEGAGGINPKTGVYRQRGALNCNGVKAAYGAIKGARIGKPMRVPASVKAKIERLRGVCGFGKED